MKFIHIADVHYGMNPDSDKPWGQERSRVIKDTFSRVILQAKHLDVDILFIAGDLFHQQPSLKELKEVNYLFSTIPAVRVVIIAGSHDRISPSSALLSFSWSSNVTWLMDSKWTSVRFDTLNTQVHGFSYHTTEITEPLITGLTIPEDDQIHILLVHGGDVTHLPIDFTELADKGFAYSALGYQHKPNLLSSANAAYPGSLEPLGKTETGQHGMILGEISPTTRKITSLEFIPLAKATYIPLVVHVTRQTTNADLAATISAEIKKRGEENIYRFRIRGKRDPEVLFDLDFLESQMRIADLIDESEPQYDFPQLFAEHPSDMIGFFIQTFNKDDLGPIEKKALCYGINALLKTMDERSRQ